MSPILANILPKELLKFPKGASRKSWSVSVPVTRVAPGTLAFYNCEPAPMMRAAIAVQRKFCRDEQIFSAIDDLTKCGIGICDAYDVRDDHRLYVDGPFLNAG